jgi:hypothetical protein
MSMLKNLMAKGALNTSSASITLYDPLTGAQTEKIALPGADLTNAVSIVNAVKALGAARFAVKLTGKRVSVDGKPAKTDMSQLGDSAATAIAQSWGEMVGAVAPEETKESEEARKTAEKEARKLAKELKAKREEEARKLAEANTEKATSTNGAAV